MPGKYSETYSRGFCSGFTPDSLFIPKRDSRIGTPLTSIILREDRGMMLNNQVFFYILHPERYPFSLFLKYVDDVEVKKLPDHPGAQV